MKNLDKYTTEIMDFIGMANDKKVRAGFIKRNLRMAYLDGKADGLEEARDIYNDPFSKHEK